VANPVAVSNIRFTKSKESKTQTEAGLKILDKLTSGSKIVLIIIAQNVRLKLTKIIVIMHLKERNPLPNTRLKNLIA